MLALQQNIYQVYLEFKRVCKLHQLRFYAEGGTKIGATHWGGFIPWDDDMDLVMPLPDYERFLQRAAADLASPFAVFDGAKCPHTDILFLKVHNRSTMATMDLTLPYPDSYTGVFIDVNPLIPVPEDPLEREAYKAELFAPMSELYNIRLFKAAGDWHALIDQIMSIIHRYDYATSKYVQPLNALRQNQLFLREDMEAASSVPFEQSTIPNPRHAKEQILTQYHNFRKDLPPAQRTGHRCLIDLNRSCDDYAKRFAAEPQLLDTFYRYTSTAWHLRQQLKELQA